MNYGNWKNNICGVVKMKQIKVMFWLLVQVSDKLREEMI